MPRSAKNNLDDLYAKHRLLQNEATSLEIRRDQLEADGSDPDRSYILDIESRALREEATKVAAWISDILDRDLQR